MMRHESPKRAAKLRRRRRMLAGWEGPPVCARWWAHSTDGSSVAATDPHEPLTRARGGPVDDDGNVIPLCRPCHEWVTAHPIEAQAEGLVVNSWSPR